MSVDATVSVLICLRLTHVKDKPASFGDADEVMRNYVLGCVEENATGAQWGSDFARLEEKRSRK